MLIVGAVQIKQGSLYQQPKKYSIVREMPQNYYTCVLFDPPKVDSLMTPVYIGDGVMAFFQCNFLPGAPTFWRNATGNSTPPQCFSARNSNVRGMKPS